FFVLGRKLFTTKHKQLMSSKDGSLITCRKFLDLPLLKLLITNLSCSDYRTPGSLIQLNQSYNEHLDSICPTSAAKVHPAFHEYTRGYRAGATSNPATTQGSFH